MSSSSTKAKEGESNKKIGDDKTADSTGSAGATSGGGNNFTCDSLSTCSSYTMLTSQYNNIVQAINGTAYGLYENSLSRGRVVATKLREFGNSMLGIEKDPFPKTHYEAILKLKSSNPKAYKEITEFALNLNKLPFEMRGEKTLEFVNQLIVNGLLGAKTGT